MAGERDDARSGRCPDGTPGGSLQAQQQADAADERAHRPALPQVLEEEQGVAVEVRGLVVGDDMPVLGRSLDVSLQQSCCFCTCVTV